MSENEKNVGTGVPNQTIIINQNENKSNGVGTAGFILALIAFFLCWVPVLDWILWILGLILSGVGVAKRPRGLAIAGLAISLVSFIILIAAAATVAAIFA